MENKDIARALRLPFVTASILPFVFGSLLAKEHFNLFNFILGLICVIGTHLSANLMNDYADSKSGADWQDKKYYIFFGGSKLIQNKVFTENFYLNLSIGCFAIAVFCVLALALLLKSFLIIVLYAFILLLAWSYSAKPLQFSYRRLGEVIIFFLFGPVPVMGGFFIQTRIFPTREGFLLSLPFGFLTAAILFANEIPDFAEDKQVGKLTWASLIALDKAFLMYLFLQLLAYLALSFCVALGFLKPLALLSFIFVALIIQAAKIIKENFSDKMKLMQSSKLTIAVQALVSIVLILALIL